MKNVASAQRLQSIKHLYEVEHLSVPQVAARLGVSRQAIYETLSRNGVRLRPRTASRISLDREILINLYVSDGLSIRRVAEMLKVDHSVIKRELLRHGIELRPPWIYRRKPTVLDDLKLGDSIIVDCRELSKPPTSLYDMASNRKMRISIRRVDADHVQVTRVE